MNQANKQKIIHYLMRYKTKLVGVIIALLITSSSVLVMSHSIGYFIDKAMVARDPYMLNVALSYFIGIALVLGIATSIRFALITLTGELVVRDIRKDMYDKILRLTPGFYEENRTGEIISRITADITLLQSVLSSTISVAARNSIMLVGSLVMLCFFSLKLTLMMLLIIPVVIVPIVYFGRKLKKAAKIYQDKIATLSAQSEETISFIKIVQAYAQEDRQNNKFNEMLLDTYRSAFTRIITRSILVFIVICMVFAGIGYILWIGGNDVLVGTMTPGQLSSFIFLSMICATTTMSLSEAFGEIQKAIGATERIFDFLNIDIAIKDSSLMLPHNTNKAGYIEFKNVTFYYPTRLSVPALQDISFTVKPGTIVAIVGESGAGKSTIIQTLIRFYDIQKGEILIDHINIKEMSLKELRRYFGYVSQEPAVFADTVYNNIAYGNPDASESDVLQAAKSASAYHFIQKLPNGFDTFLGERGVKLSGGQKQRITIARAILKNPKILLLDEATSSLDSKNELAVQEALETLMSNRTTIVIAHRLSTIINAHEIIFLKEGAIVARGTHQELLRSSKDYTKHFSLHLAGKSK